MCIISYILGRLSWNDGSWPVDFSLDVDLECNLERILKGLLHWQIECWWGRLFCSYVYGRICEGSFCGLIHCCGDAPVPLRERRWVLAEARVILEAEQTCKAADC